MQIAGPASHSLQTAEAGKQLAVVVDAVPEHDGKRARIPKLRDGNAAERITQVLHKWPQQLRERLQAAP